MAASTFVMSRTGTVRMAGSSTTSAPLSRSMSDSVETSSRGRVTSTRTPARGRFSAQPKLSARAHTLPTTMIAGVCMTLCAHTRSSVPTVALTRRCLDVVPRSSTAAGISGSMPAASRPFIRSGSAAMPIRNTSVPLVRTSASKSMS